MKTLKALYYWAAALIKRFRVPLILSAAATVPFALGKHWDWLAKHFPGTVLFYVGALVLSIGMYLFYVVDERTK
jgi:xanthine/uracil permease